MSIETITNEKNLADKWQLVKKQASDLDYSVNALEIQIAELEALPLYTETASQDEIALIAAYKAKVAAYKA